MSPKLLGVQTDCLCPYEMEMELKLMSPVLNFVLKIGVGGLGLVRENQAPEPRVETANSDLY